jgi:hypothetical protein
LEKGKISVRKLLILYKTIPREVSRGNFPSAGFGVSGKNVYLCAVFRKTVDVWQFI